MHLDVYRSLVFQIKCFGILRKRKKWCSGQERFEIRFSVSVFKIIFLFVKRVL